MTSQPLIPVLPRWLLQYQHKVHWWVVGVGNNEDEVALHVAMGKTTANIVSASESREGGAKAKVRTMLHKLYGHLSIILVY